MKTSYIVTAVVVLLLIAGAGYYLANRSATAPDTQLAQESAMPEPSGNTLGMEQTNSSPMPGLEDKEASATAAAKDEEGVTEIVVNGSNFKFEPNSFTVKSGEKVRVVFKNTQGFHDFTVEGMPEVKTKQIQAPNEDSIEFTPTKTGTFEFYCSVGKHRQMGMKGTLIVQ